MSIFLDQLETKTNVQKWFKELIETYCVEKIKGKKQVTIQPWSFMLEAKSSNKFKNILICFTYYRHQQTWSRKVDDDYIKINIISGKENDIFTYRLFNDSNFERLKKILKLHIKLAKGMEEFYKFNKEK